MIDINGHSPPRMHRRMKAWMNSWMDVYEPRSLLPVYSSVLESLDSLSFSFSFSFCVCFFVFFLVSQIPVRLPPFQLNPFPGGGVLCEFPRMALGVPFTWERLPLIPRCFPARTHSLSYTRSKNKFIYIWFKVTKLIVKSYYEFDIFKELKTINESCI